MKVIGDNGQHDDHKWCCVTSTLMLVILTNEEVQIQSPTTT